MPIKVITFSVRPFSGARYYENSQKCPDDKTPCGICGKGTSDHVGFWAHVCEGGAIWCDEDEYECSHSKAGDMGMWPIGPDCYRRYAVKPGVPHA